MKGLVLTLTALLIFLGSYSQNTDEAKIRELENDMKIGFLKRDTVMLLKVLSPKFVVNSPWNRVSTFEDVMIGLRKGGGDMLSFEKSIEKITFTENIAIVMSQETRKATGEAVNAGKTFQRRFADVWKNTKNSSQLVARQSTVFLVE